MSKYEVISGPSFPAFGLKTERYEVSFRIQSESGKIRTKNNPVFGHFHAVWAKQLFDRLWTASAIRKDKHIESQKHWHIVSVTNWYVQNLHKFLIHEKNWCYMLLQPINLKTILVIWWKQLPEINFTFNRKTMLMKWHFLVTKTYLNVAVKTLD